MTTLVTTPARKHHILKCWPQHFNAVWNKTKLFEIRRNDRDYQEGDTFTLCEYEYDHGEVYTGRQVSGRIGHISNFAQQDGYVVFSLLNIGLLIIGDD